MLRAIFLPEFKRSLFQKLLVILPALALLFLLEHLVTALGLQDAVKRTFNGDPASIVNMLLWILMIVSTFLLGAGAFSRINERHIPFLHSLPISRVEVWVGITTAHFLAALLALPLVLVLRPSMWTDFSVAVVAGGNPYAASVALVSFAAGCCFVMLFRSLIASAAVGGLITFLSCLLIFPFAVTFNYRGYGPGDRVYGIPMDSFRRPDAAFWAIASIFLAVVYLGLSLRFFMKGEFNLTRRRLRSWAVLVASLLVFPLFLAAGIDTGTLRYSVGEDAEFLVSPNGKYLAVIRRGIDQTLAAKVDLVDISTGKLVSTYRGVGSYREIIWSGTSKPVLNLHRLQSALERLAYALPPTDSVVRLSPGNKPAKTTFGFSEIEDLGVDNKERLWVITTTRGRQHRLFSVSEDGVATEAVSTPGRDDPAIVRTATMTFFTVSSQANGLERAWSLEPTVQEIPYAPGEKSRANGKYLLDDGWYSERTVVAALNERFSMADEIAKRGKDTYAHYLGRSEVNNWDEYWSFPFKVMPSKWVFALVGNRVTGGNQVMAFRAASRQWQTIGEALPFEGRLAANIRAGLVLQEIGLFRNLGEVHTDPEQGFVTYFEDRGGDRVTNLYDATLNRSFELFSQSKSASESARCFQIHRHDLRLEGTMIRCGGRSFVYRQGRGVSRVPIYPGTPVYFGNDGSSIWRNWNRSESRPYVTFVSADRAERQLWPVR
jgi:hypothetical protein